MRGRRPASAWEGQKPQSAVVRVSLAFLLESPYNKNRIRGERRFSFSEEGRRKRTPRNSLRLRRAREATRSGTFAGGAAGTLRKNHRHSDSPSRKSTVHVPLLFLQCKKMTSSSCQGLANRRRVPSVSAGDPRTWGGREGEELAPRSSVFSSPTRPRQQSLLSSTQTAKCSSSDGPEAAHRPVREPQRRPPFAVRLHRRRMRPPSLVNLVGSPLRHVR